MTSARVGQIFQEALDRPEAERAAYLDHACDGDSELRAQVEKLLAALEEAGSFFAEPKSEEAGEQAGAVIDRYKLLQEIGEGGMGVVWMAEQQEPVRRKVALKVIKLGMDTRQVVARFEAERQALAMMDHPNIAKVLDGGATPQGRPYFVMELVKGVPLTEYCDQANLSATERLELFQQVCHAVQHAHQKGVIHRDLKPGNILVTQHDGVAMPKVIDFGIAKATSAELTQRTMFTEFREMIGTPEYMAPEQAEMSALDIDTRADVYSLGVVLYEVLTGTKPFEIAKVLEKGYAEMMRVIREDDPPKPSTRVSTLGESLASVAQRRHTTPAALGKLMRGDLDWIVMRALDKDRNRRYATAIDLAADIGRHLSHEPVQAGPPSASYRLRKYVRRNRVTVIAGAMVFGALLAGLGAATWGFLEAVDQRDRAVFAEKDAERERDAADDARELAVAEKERADGEADNARKSATLATAEAARATKEANRAATVLDLVNEMLGSANPDRLKGPNYTVRQVLADFERGLGERLRDQPEIEVSLRTLIARSYNALGVYRTGDANFERALRVLESLPAADSHVKARILHGLSVSSRGVQRFVEAEDQARRALAAELAGASPDPVFCAELRAGRAIDLAKLGRYDEAEPLVRGALAELQGLPDVDAMDAYFGWVALSEVTAQMHSYDESERAARRALDLTIAKHGDAHPRTSRAWAVLANVLAAKRELADAEQAFERTLAIDRERLGERHPNVGITLRDFAELRMRQTRRADANAMLGEAVELLRASLGEDHHHTHRALTLLAESHSQLMQFDDAEEHARASLVIQERVGATPWMMADNLRILAFAARKRDRLEEAEVADRKAVELLEADPKWTASRGAERLYYQRGMWTLRWRLSQTLFSRGKMDEARHMIEDLVAEVRASEDTDEARIQRYRLSLGRVLLGQAEQAAATGKLGEAEARRVEALELLRDVLETQQKLWPEGLDPIASTHLALANALEPVGAVPKSPEVVAACEAHFRSALRILDEPDGQQRRRYRTALVGLGRTLRDQQKNREAVAVLRRAREMSEQHFAANDRDTLTVLSDLGVVLFRAGEYAEAETVLRDVIGRRQMLGQPVPAYDWMFLTNAFTWPRNAANSYTAEEREESLRLQRNTMVAGKRDWPAGHPMAGAFELNYAGSLFDMRRYADAVPAYRDALQRLPQARQQEPRFVNTLREFALCLLFVEEWGEAEQIARRLHEIRAAATPESWLRYNAMSLLGGALLGQGKFEAAEPLVLEAFEKMDPPNNGRVLLVMAHKRIVQLYEQWGREAEAEKWRAKAPEGQKREP